MNIQKRILEKITITGTRTDGDKEFDEAYALHREGDYSILSAGPLPCGDGRFDTNQFRVVAERDITDKMEASS